MEPEQDFDVLDPDSVSATSLPNFIPTQAQKVASPEAEPLAATSTVEQAIPVVAGDGPVPADPIVPPAVDAVVTGAVNPDVDATAEQGEEVPERTHAGILIDHGEARYKDLPDEKMSYFVALETPNGLEKIWGIDLRRAMKETGAVTGDALRLDFMGSRTVMTHKLLRNEKGEVIGREPIEAERNTWVARSIEPAALERLNETLKAHSPGEDEPVPPHASEYLADALGSPESLGGPLDQKALDALMQVAGQVKPRAGAVNPDELMRVNAALQSQPNASIPGAGATRGQEQVRTGAEALIEGGASLLGGAAALTGTVLKGVGQGAAALAGAIAGRAKSNADADFSTFQSVEHEETRALEAPLEAAVEASSESPVVEGENARVNVLPRLSEYRVDQVDRSANNYESAHEAFWQADRLPLIRQEIEALAEAEGLSVEDVMDKMKPNGEYADLHGKFVEAVAESPDAQNSKKAMDKALEGWTRQFGRAQEELLNPETEGNPHYENLKERLGKSSDRMHKNASQVPAFEGEDQSHIDRLKEAMLRLVERLKEMAERFVNFVRGKSSAKASESGGTDNAPAP